MTLRLYLYEEVSGPSINEEHVVVIFIKIFDCIMAVCARVVFDKCS